MESPKSRSNDGVKRDSVDGKDYLLWEMAKMNAAASLIRPKCSKGNSKIWKTKNSKNQEREYNDYKVGKAKSPLSSSSFSSSSSSSSSSSDEDEARDEVAQYQDLIAACSLMTCRDGAVREGRKLAVCQKNDSDRYLVTKTISNYRKSAVATLYW